MAIAQRRMTLEEFLKLPEQKPALEFMNGVVTQKVSPKARHGALQTEVAILIDRLARPRKLARAFTETRTTFAGGSPVPDVVVYRWERVPRDERGEVAEDFFVAPDIAVEVLSPSQSVRSQANRCRWYVENGSRIALLVNPRDRSVTDFRPGAQPVVLRGTDRIDFGDVLPGVFLVVKDLFDSLSMD